VGGFAKKCSRSLPFMAFVANKEKKKARKKKERKKNKNEPLESHADVTQRSATVFHTDCLVAEEYQNKLIFAF
jgi:hypothetical protein